MDCCSLMPFDESKWRAVKYKLPRRIWFQAAGSSFPSDSVQRILQLWHLITRQRFAYESNWNFKPGLRIQRAERGTQCEVHLKWNYFTWIIRLERLSVLSLILSSFSLWLSRQTREGRQNRNFVCECMAITGSRKDRRGRFAWNRTNPPPNPRSSLAVLACSQLQLETSN